MKHVMFLIAGFFGCLLMSHAQQLAFPTAEGYGKYATGGRGGRVVAVTNLNDTGAGSLRYAVSSFKNQPRTIIFKVSGTIELKSPLDIKDDSYLTIAGQTAPGDGICLKNYPLYIQRCHDIVVRFLRMRPGDEQACTSCDDIDATSILTCYNIILDHCSFSWAIDANLDLTHETGLSTIQYCILSEALLNSKHSKGAHSMAAGWDGQQGATYHHNLIASCNSRTPRLDKYMGATGRDLIDMVNNVLYNWDGNGAYGGENADVNWVNNYYRSGPSTNASRKKQIFQCDGEGKMYLAGNYVEGYPDVTDNNAKGLYVGGGVASTTDANNILVNAPFSSMGIAQEAANACFESVLSHAGACFPKRDAVDLRIVNEVDTYTGSVIDSPSEVGGWAVYNSVDAPVDTDSDGMPDAWETAMGLDPTDANDRNGDLNADGFTNLEEYLNSLVADIVITKRPLNVRAVAQYDTANVVLTWVDALDGETGFVVERANAEMGPYTKVGQAGTNDTSFTDVVAEKSVFYYRVKATFNDTASFYTYSGKMDVADKPVSTTKLKGDVLQVSCFPQPFSSVLQVNISLAVSGNTKATLYDLQSRTLAVLVDGTLPAGPHTFEWKADNVPAGLYLLRVESAQGVSSYPVVKN